MVLDLLPDLSDDEKRLLRLRGCLPERDEDIPRFPPVPQHQVPPYCTGGEFDVAKPLMEDGVHYRDEACRSSKKIKRFFAEVHYKAPECSDPSFLPPCIATVETCPIIEEPLAQYKRSCAFCHSYLDILHPVDDSEFVCGNGNEEDWNVQEWFGLRFICRKGEAFPFDEE
uniref:Uncharacterized protein n=1 Tax=Setaria viridis TaxID=4556 RepID=A0A4U6UYZ0_SETVI|nr:hypothetical protein SEVIR_4G026400v2 [Setaria viridis]